MVLKIFGIVLRIIVILGGGFIVNIVITCVRTMIGTVTNNELESKVDRNHHGGMLMLGCK